MPRFYHRQNCKILPVQDTGGVLWELKSCGLQVRRPILCQYFSSDMHELVGWLNLPRRNDHMTVVNNYLAETTFILQFVDA